MDQNKPPFLEIITAGFSDGEVKTFVLAGGYFELIDAPYPVTVRLVDRYGTLRGYMTQAEASFYMRQGEFDAIEIISPNAQTIRFAYGSSESGTRRTSGVVSVIDDGFNKTARKNTFCSHASITGVAAVNSHIQIYNPLASGKRLVFNAFNASSSIAGGVVIQLHNAELLNIIANRIENKNSTGLNSVAETRAENKVAINQRMLYATVIPANSFFNWNPTEPIFVDPGQGIQVFHSIVNSDIAFSSEFYEIPI